MQSFWGIWVPSSTTKCGVTCMSLISPRCESVMAALRSRLDERDARIAELREELARTKVQLAGSRAVEDELRHSLMRQSYSGGGGTRRRSSVVIPRGVESASEEDEGVIGVDDDMLSDKAEEGERSEDPRLKSSTKTAFRGSRSGTGVPDLDESSVSRDSAGGCRLDESYKTSSSRPLDESYRTAASALTNR